MASSLPTAAPGGPAAVAPPSTTTPPRAPVPPLPEPLPGQRRDLVTAGDVQRAVIADLDGDGHRELVVADPRSLRVLDAGGRERASVPAPGGIQILTAVDVDGDHRAEVLAGWGLTREHLDAQSSIVAYRLTGRALAATTVIAPTTSRPDIAAIVPGDGGVVVAYYVDKYQVASGLARPAGKAWSIAPLVSARMAGSFARGDLDGDGVAELAVGRIYGDGIGVDGDAFVVGADGARTSLPVTRGVRGLALADTDGDGRPELFVGDGWHSDYGRIARGLLTWIRRDAAGYHAELIEDTPGQYAIWRILPADVDGDGRLELVTMGSHYVRLYGRDGAGWHGTTIAGEVRDVATGDLDGKPGDEIVLVGDRLTVVSLATGSR